MALNKKSPEVRFDGFSDKWKNEQLLHLGDFLKGNGYSKNDLKKSGHPIILYGRLYTNYNLLIEDIDTFVEPKDGSVYSEGGEVIIPSSGESAEDIIVASVIKNKHIIIGGDLNVIRPYEALNSQFVALSISNGGVYNELVKKAQGKSVVHIRNNDLQETFLPYPHISEQEKIANLFLGLDKLITKHQTQLTKLKNLKSAMLVKMFPQEGAKVPEIRFKGFSGEWELFPFKTLAKCRRGLTYSPSDTRNKGIKVLRSSNIDNDTFLEQDDDVYVKKEAINIDFIKEGDILITAANGSSRLVGKHAIVEVLKNKAVHGGFMLIAETNVPYFLNASMSSTWYSRFLKQNIAGGNGAIGNLKGNSLEEYLINIPKEDEQIKIGEYFKNLDSLISNQKEQLNKLQNIKKALLDKLFVN
ncbi:restriction endonuclease subunit S [Flagellimonas marinaquae]|uniref:restriction endonuclease subunit S n=1 Tax=Flagellimonas marinaquae TaxID=254955 RepID=UPI000F8E68E0|nr:restriction endonuclease subunit S [Allomuricauda aquimarina]